MALSDRAAAVGPYAQQLLDNKTCRPPRAKPRTRPGRRISVPAGRTPARPCRTESYVAASPTAVAAVGRVRSGR